MRCSVIQTINWKEFWKGLFFLVVWFPLLGSSVTFCDTGDIYNKAYDQSDEYSYRWSNGGAQRIPHWTPDGSHIVFGYGGRIFVVDAAGSDLQSLSGTFELAHLYSQTAEIDFSPTVSPDGARVAYTTLRYATGELREHTYEIAVQSIDGSDRKRLTNNSWNDVSPSWSPDGSRLAFVSEREDGRRAFTVAPDGSDELSVAPLVNTGSNAPVWSPDGGRLAFVGKEREYSTLDYVDTYDSDNPITKTYEETTYGEAVYTVNPDGSGLLKLAWLKTPDSAPSIRIGINDVIDPEENVTSFAWSPDGSNIAFVASYYGQSDGLYVANPDTSEVQQVLDLSTILEARQYYRSPDGYDDWAGTIQGLAFSPDGSQIILEVVGFWVDGDTLAGRRGLFMIAADGSGSHHLMEEVDGEHVTSHAKSYLEWPVSQLGRVPESPGSYYRPPLLDYQQNGNFLTKSTPAQITVYTDSKNANVWPDVEGWVLTINPWGQDDKTVLVRITDRKLVAAN